MSSCFSAVSFPSVPKSTFASTSPVDSLPASFLLPDSREAVEDSELMGDDLDSLLDGIPTEQGPAEVKCAVFVLVDQQTDFCC